MTEELVIDESNFSEYFRDVRMHSRPQRGEVMARYTATAEFVDGHMKRDIIDLLHNKNKVEAAIQVMRKLGSATEKDAIRICKEICRDLASGMSLKEVEDKTYKYQLELFYYTKKELIPLDDPHWSVISLKNLDEFLDMAGQRVKMTATLLPSDEQPPKDDNGVQ